MRRSNATLGEIISATGLSKTTVFYHVRDIPKTKALLGRISTINSANSKFARLALNKAGFGKGKSFKTYPYNKPNQWTPDFVMLVAHLMFDGEINHSSCIYNNRSDALIRRIVKLMHDVIGVDDYKYYKKSDGVQRVSYHHVEITIFMEKKSRELLKYILEAPTDQKIAFLRAFFDDEGSMCFEHKKRVVRGYQHSHERLLLVQKLLADIGIASTLDNRHVEITISRRENLIKFQKLINFSEGVYINPDRSNSMWKQLLQKRDILQMALASYQTV